MHDVMILSFCLPFLLWSYIDISTLLCPFPVIFLSSSFSLWFDTVYAVVPCILFRGCVSGDDLFCSELSSVVVGTDVHDIGPDPVDTQSDSQHSSLSPPNDLPPEVPDSCYSQLSDPQIRFPTPPIDHFHPSVQSQPIEQRDSDSQKKEMDETERDGWVTENIKDFPLPCKHTKQHT